MPSGLSLNFGLGFSRRFGGGVSPIERLLDPTKPLPMFFDGWALNDFIGMLPVAPNGSGIPADSMGAVNLEFTVSGSEGDSALTISSGDQTKGTNTWGGVIQHDDGTYGTYIVSSLGSDACTIFPNLRADVTAGTLRNMGSGVNGQHYTEPGYRALAQALFGATRDRAYHNRWAFQWRAATGVKADWTNIGGMTSGQYSLPSTNVFHTSGVGKMINAAYTRGRLVLSASPASPSTGKGLEKTFSGLAAVSGLLEIIGTCQGATGFGSLRVVVLVNSVSVYDQSTTTNDGLVRLRIPVSGANTVTIRLTAADESGGNFGGPKLNSATLWVYDREEDGFAWTDPLIKKNGKIVIIGDSWTTWYPEGGSGVDGVLGTELQAAMAAAGGSGSVVSVGQSGTTAEFGLTVFDSLVAPEAPDQVVFLYFTNDHNQYSVDRWKAALFTLGVKAQAIGAEPIFIGALPTASISQSVDHGVWADELLKGVALA